MLYRVGEAQLIKMASPFMLDPRNLGGLGLTTGDVGLLYGTFGILALTAGGILGGIAASTKGFRYWLWWMVLAINVPHLAYVYMSFAQPENQLIIGLCVVLEQFSYGFGFTAYMLYMIYISEGKKQNRTFCYCHRFYGFGNDASGNVFRLAAGNYWLSKFLCLGYAVHDSRYDSGILHQC